MKKLEIVMFYCVFISFVTLFWAVLFKFLFPTFLIWGTVFAFVITTMMSMILLTKCFIEFDKRNKLIADSLEHIYDY